MNKSRIKLVSLLIFLLIGGFLISTCKKIDIQDYSIENRLPEIDPEYFNTVIPANIAPLNFIIQESGLNYFVKVFSENGIPIEI